MSMLKGFLAVALAGSLASSLGAQEVREFKDVVYARVDGRALALDDVAFRDLETSVLWRHRDVGRRIDVVGLEARRAQDERQRHCKAARMGRSEQFLRVRPLTVLEARRKRVRTLECAVSKLERALAFLDRAFPSRVSCACRHIGPFQFHLIR